jgi:hypothetical protein
MIKFKRINGWSYRTSDDKFIISNCGPRQWFSAEVDEESSARHGFLIALENTKVYHTTLGTAQDWVCSFNYSEKENA